MGPNMFPLAQLLLTNICYATNSSHIYISSNANDAFIIP